MNKIKAITYFFLTIIAVQTTATGDPVDTIELVGSGHNPAMDAIKKNISVSHFIKKDWPSQIEALVYGEGKTQPKSIKSLTVNREPAMFTAWSEGRLYYVVGAQNRNINGHYYYLSIGTWNPADGRTKVVLEKKDGEETKIEKVHGIDVDDATGKITYSAFGTVYIVDKHGLTPPVALCKGKFPKFSETGKTIYFVNNDGVSSIRSNGLGEKALKLDITPQGKPISGLAISPKGDAVAIVVSNLLVLSSIDGQTKKIIELPVDEIGSIFWSKDNCYLLFDNQKASYKMEVPLNYK